MIPKAQTFWFQYAGRVAAQARLQRPTQLPERSKLPPEAIIQVRSLKAFYATIEKGMGKLTKPLPIICVAHPHMRLDAAGGTHPDPEGKQLAILAFNASRCVNNAVFDAAMPLLCARGALPAEYEVTEGAHGERTPSKTMSLSLKH